MADVEKRRSFTEEDLAGQAAKLQASETKETDMLNTEKPDEKELEGAKKRLSNVGTIEKVILPTAEDIAKEASGEAQAAAETALQEGRKSLKPGDMIEKNSLPTADDINAEQAAELNAAEVLSEAKRKLSNVETVEKQALPTPADVAAEKTDKSCNVESEAMKKARESQSKAQAQGKSFGTVDKGLGIGAAGAGGGFGLNAPGYGVKVEHFTAAAKKQIDVADEVGIQWVRVMDDEQKDVNWVYCKYSADNKKLELTAKGEGGLSEFKKQIDDDLAWGAFRCYGVDKRGGAEVRRTKFVFVQVKPEAASTIKKAKQVSHKSDVKLAIHDCHLDVVVEKADDLDEQELITKLQAATGAHKPNGYEFDVGNFIEADYYGLGIGKDCKGETSKN